MTYSYQLMTLVKQEKEKDRFLRQLGLRREGIKTTTTVTKVAKGKSFFAIEKGSDGNKSQSVVNQRQLTAINSSTYPKPTPHRNAHLSQASSKTISISSNPKPQNRNGAQPRSSTSNSSVTKLKGYDITFHTNFLSFYRSN